MDVSRIAWLRGGLVATSYLDEPVCQILAGLHGCVVCTMDQRTDGPLFPALLGLGLQPLGASFVVDEEQRSGIAPAEFRAIDPMRRFLSHEVGTAWSQVANSAWRANCMSLFDLAARIRTGIRACEHALERAGRAYSSQLRSSVHHGHSLPGRKFSDRCTESVYQSVHGALWELAALRDTLAEFAATYAFGVTERTKFKGLIAIARKQPNSHPLSKYLVESATAPNGWAARLTDYRNLFTHDAPMQYAVGLAAVIAEQLRLRTGDTLPIVYFPLPADALTASQERKSGPPFQTTEDALRRIHSAPARAQEPDALDYIAQALSLMVEFGEKLLPYSPLAPAPIVLSDDELAR